MSEEKSDNDSQSSLKVPNFVGPSGARSHFEGLPLPAKFSALSFYCARIYGLVKEEGPLWSKNEELKLSVDTCMVCLSALVSALEDSGVSGFSGTEGQE